MKEDNKIWKLLAKKAAGEANDEELSELYELLETEGDIRWLMSLLDTYWITMMNLPESQKSHNN